MYQIYTNNFSSFEEDFGRYFYYFTMENYWPDSGLVILHVNRYVEEKDDWDVATEIVRKDGLSRFFAMEDIRLPFLSSERFDEDQVNKVLWDTPFVFEGNERAEESLQSIERQKENYQEVIRKSGDANGSPEERLKPIFQHREATKPFIRTYAVGQANLSALFESEEASSPLGVFDFGIVENKKKISDIIMNQFTSDGFVLLSHFDCDHINGCNLPPTAPIFQRTWISHLPSKSPKQGMMLKLFSRVPSDHWVFLLPGASLPLPHLQIDVAMMNDPLTGRPDPFQSSEENGTCAMALVSYNCSFLLPGDALYGNFTGSYAPNYCLIPHHSCAYDVPIPKKKMDCSKVEFANIPVSFSGQRKYHHPNYSHFSQYRKVGRFIKLDSDPASCNAEYFESGLWKSDSGNKITEKCNCLYKDFYL